MDILKGKIVCIEGGIGVGKSTLGTSLVKELTQQNIESIFYTEPFTQGMLEKFLTNPVKYAYPFQLYMLTRRQVVFVQAIQQAQQGKCCIIDRSLIGDLVFATLQYESQNITKEDYRVYKEVYDQFKEYEPDCIVYLDAPASKQAERIRIRNRNKEDAYDMGYLDNLNSTYLKTLQEEFNLPNRQISIVDWSSSVPVNNGILNTESTNKIIDLIKSSFSEI